MFLFRICFSFLFLFLFYERDRVDRVFPRLGGFKAKSGGSSAFFTPSFDLCSTGLVVRVTVFFFQPLSFDLLRCCCCCLNGFWSGLLPVYYLPVDMELPFRVQDQYPAL